MAILVNRSGRNEQSLYSIAYWCFLRSFIWSFGFSGEKFLKSANQKKESPVAVMFANGSREEKHFLQGTCHWCFLLSFGSFSKAVSETKNFRNWPIRNKNFLRQPRLSMDQNEMRNLDRWPSIDASSQDSVHLANRFHSRKVLKISQSEIRIACDVHVC